MDDASSSSAVRATLARGTSRPVAALAIAGLVVASLVLRWFGLGFQLPHFVPVDSLVLASEVEVMRHHGDPSYRLWPNLYPRLIPGLVLLLPSEKPDDPPPSTLEGHLARARAPYMRVCVVIALLSVLAIPCTYLLARRFLERSWSLLAAALVGTSVLHLWFSQAGRPHSAATSVILLAVLAALRLRRKPVLSSYLLAGLAVGAAIGTLQSGVAALLPFAAAFLLRSRRGPRSSPWLVVLSLLLAAGVAYALYPFAGGMPNARSGEAREMFAFRGSNLSLMGHAIFLPNFNGDGFPVIAGALWAYDPLIAATFAAGVLAAAVGWTTRRRSRGRSSERAVPGPAHRRDLLVVLAFAVPYTAAIGLYHFSEQRFLLPLIPYIAIAAAYGLGALGRFAATRGPVPRVAAAAIVVVLLVVQTYGAARLSIIRARPDTATEAASWIRVNVRPGTERVLLTPRFDLPLLQTKDAIARNEPSHRNRNQRWFAYQVESVPDSSAASERYDVITLPLAPEEDRAKFLKDPAQFLLDLDAGWIVIEVRRTWDWRGVVQLRSVLGKMGELAARFAPDEDADRYGDAPIAHQGFDPRPFPIPWFRRILGARCTGSVLEIWKIRR